jgi:hypothetical protein
MRHAYLAPRIAWLATTVLLCASLGISVARAACVPTPSAALHIDGATICMFIDGDSSPTQRRQLQVWVERSARIVSQYYKRFSASEVALRIHSVEGTGVHGGRTINDPPLTIQVSVGSDTSAPEFAADWVLVHEMVHLALPEVGRRHLWLAEGLATYVEGIARAQAGNRDIRDVWAEQRRSMPRGLPQPGEGGMDQTSTWGRTYWGGALFCLQADIAIREQTRNVRGLQSALQAILQQTGGYGSEREINEVFRIGDAATGTHVLEDLYEKTKATAVVVDLNRLWDSLGVPADPTSQPFDDHAPLAAIRIAITAPAKLESR